MGDSKINESISEGVMVFLLCRYIFCVSDRHAHQKPLVSKINSYSMGIILMPCPKPRHFPRQGVQLSPADQSSDTRVPAGLMDIRKYRDMFDMFCWLSIVASLLSSLMFCFLADKFLQFPLLLLYVSFLLRFPRLLLFKTGLLILLCFAA